MTACLQELEGQLQALKEAWALRRDCYEENWCLQKLRQGLDQAEAWLASREGLLLDPNCGVSQGLALSPAALSSSYSQGKLLRLLLSTGHPGWAAEGEGKALGTPGSWFSPCLPSPQDSVSDVELLLCRHQDLEKLLAAQEEKFVQLQRKVGVSKAGEKEYQEMGPEGWWWERSQSQLASWRGGGGLPRALALQENPIVPLASCSILSFPYPGRLRCHCGLGREGILT